MDNELVKWVVDWGLARLSERNTWATWIAVAGVKILGGQLDPAFDNLLINAALGLVAVIGYAVKGKPILEGKK